MPKAFFDLMTAGVDTGTKITTITTKESCNQARNAVF